MASIDRRFLDVRLVVEGYDDGSLVKEVLPVGADDPDNPGTPLTAEKTINYTPVKGMQFIVANEEGETAPATGGAFASAAENDIAIYDGTAWKFVKPQIGNMEFLFLKDTKDDDGTALTDERTNVLKKWDGSNFVKILDLPSAEELAEANENLSTANENIKNFIDDADSKIRQMVKDYDNEVTEVHEVTEDEITAKEFDLTSAIETGKEGAVRVFVGGVAQTNGDDFTAANDGDPAKGKISWTDKGLDRVGLIAGDKFTVIYEGPATKADDDYKGDETLLDA